MTSEAGEKEVVVYRSGALTPDNFTPRPEKDTAAPEGQHPGLSAFTSPEPGGRRKYQGIENKFEQDIQNNPYLT